MNHLMLVSGVAKSLKPVTKRVSRIAYRIISITCFENFEGFLLSVEKKEIHFFACRLHALHIRVFDPKDRPLWSTLHTSIIPKLYNLQYLELLDDREVSPQVKDLRLLAISSLSNLTYLGFGPGLVEDNTVAHFPLFPAVTHVKRFRFAYSLQTVSHLLNSFPSLSHLMTGYSQTDQFERILAPLVQPLSHLKVIILGCYRDLDRHVPKSTFERFPNLVFRRMSELYGSSDAPRFIELARDDEKNIWKLCEEEVIQRRQS
ncbi:hypothetical protein DL96DRAFT_1586100 [Flagelloscypha sp. PMI_526]|nr:hypothetical protein DL96DRAFT_1586100 [Flagelloscypha sp. PMI_526]